jgi:hypothetical protein
MAPAVFQFIASVIFIAGVITAVITVVTRHHCRWG